MAIALANVTGTIAIEGIEPSSYAFSIPVSAVPAFIEQTRGMCLNLAQLYGREAIMQLPENAQAEAEILSAAEPVVVDADASPAPSPEG